MSMLKIELIQELRMHITSQKRTCKYVVNASHSALYDIVWSNLIVLFIAAVAGVLGIPQMPAILPWPM